MKQEYDKLVELVPLMALEAYKEYSEANEIMGYAKSILLSEAALGITAPVLSQIGVTPTQEFWAGVAESYEGNEQNKNQAFNEIRQIYNKLKHAGFKPKKVEALDDLDYSISPEWDTFKPIADLHDDIKKLIQSKLIDPDKLPEDVKLFVLKKPQRVVK